MQDALTRAVEALTANEELHQVDRPLGRYLCALPAWSERQTKAALRMASKYVARLRGAYGISAADLQGVEGCYAMARPSLKDGCVTKCNLVTRAPRGSVGVNCTAFTVRFAPAAELIEAARVLPGARWDAEGGAWRVPMTVAGAERLFEFAELYGFAIEPEVFGKVDELTGAAAVAAGASRSEEADYPVEGVRKALRPYQMAGVRYLVEVAKGRALVCDEMGLGKTIETLAAVRKMEAWPLLVICPAGLKYNWAREIEEGVGLRALVVEETKISEERDGGNYSGETPSFAPGTGALPGGGALRRNVRARAILWSGRDLMFREKKGGGMRCKQRELEPCRATEYGQGYERAAAVVVSYTLLMGEVFEALRRVKWGAVIMDESHSLRNAKTRQTKAVREIVRGVPVRFAVSGTPVVNTVSDLLPQLSAIGRLEDLGGFWPFAERYCAAKKVKVRARGGEERFERFIWDLSGRSNAKELHERLRAACFLRRLKKHVLAELPPKVHSTVPLEIDNRDEYRRAEEDVVQFLAAKAAGDKEFLASIAHLPEEDRIARAEARHLEKAEQLAEEAMLVRFEALKQLCAKGKMAATKEWIGLFMESGEKLVVFGWHTESLKELAGHFGAPVILGETAPKAREATVRRFQDDPGCRLLFLNIQAGGVGLTLTAASNCAVFELPWTPAALDQAEDRLHRFGQARSVTIWNLMGRNTIDWQIYGIVRAKRSVVGAVVDGVGDEDGGRRKTVRELAEAFLAPRLGNF